MTVSDISPLKEAEAFLAQTQRLISLGEMASGVAHNFNNILQVVVGNLELILMDMEKGDLSNVRDSLQTVLHTFQGGSRNRQAPPELCKYPLPGFPGRKQGS